MRKIELSKCINDIEENIIKINDISNQIVGFKKPHNNMSKEKFFILFENITSVLSYWTGCTFIGCKKSKPLEKAFNRFFINLYDLILFVKSDERIPKQCREEVAKSLFRGKLYRYLGYSSEEFHFLNNHDKSKHIEPIYNNIYVSWSKNSENSYIEQKLRGPITKIECEVPYDMYGIDLEIFGVSRGNESEVVFPTIEKTIVKIEKK